MKAKDPELTYFEHSDPAKKDWDTCLGGDICANCGEPAGAHVIVANPDMVCPKFRRSGQFPGLPTAMGPDALTLRRGG